MSELQTDEERIEQIKEWWKENGRAVVFGVILGVGGLISWNAWGEYKSSRAEAASIAYDDLRKAIDEKQAQTLDASLLRLQEDYRATPYAALAALDVAGFKVETDDLAAAESALRWAYDNAGQEGVKEVAGLRLVRVLIAQDKLDEAMAVLNNISAKAYAALADELRGDVYRAKGEMEQARSAYDRALSVAAQSNTEYLRLKRDSLGEPSAAVKEAS